MSHDGETGVRYFVLDDSFFFIISRRFIIMTGHWSYFPLHVLPPHPMPILAQPEKRMYNNIKKRTREKRENVWPSSSSPADIAPDDGDYSRNTIFSSRYAVKLSIDSPSARK